MNKLLRSKVLAMFAMMLIILIGTQSEASAATLMTREGYNGGEGEFGYLLGAYRAGKTAYTADMVAKVIFSTTAPATYETYWDVSYTNGAGQIKSYLVESTEYDGYYDQYIVSTTGITAPSYSGFMFRGYTDLISIENMSMVDTSSVTIMKAMFYECYSLQEVDVSGFSTSNVTNMGWMFGYCHELVEVDVSGFNTAKVTDMQSMFESCYNLETLDVSNFSTVNVTNMCSMFFDCNALAVLDVSGFNTSKVTDMSGMFAGCSTLTSLNVSGFTTTNVTDMRVMFAECTNVTKIDVSNFNTSKVTDMSYMFSECTNVSKLDVSNFTTTNVTDMCFMFNGCSSLTTLDVDGFTTTNVTDMCCMFNGCSSLTTLDVRNFSTSNVTDMSYMFEECASLTTLDLSNFNTSNVTDMSYMFSNCTNLHTLLLGKNFDRINGNKMFYSSNKLVRVVSLNSNVMDVSTDCNLGTFASRKLYVPTTTVEASYEAKSTYKSLLGTDRIKPILELAGYKSTKTVVNASYADAGVTVMGCDSSSSSVYTALKFAVATTGLPISTTSVGTKTVTYKLNYTNSAGTTSTLATETRTVNIVEKAVLMSREDALGCAYMLGAHRANNQTTYSGELVTKIEFTTEVPEGYTDSWDVSENEGDNILMSYIVPSSNIGGIQYYTQYIVSPTEKIFLSSGARFFENYKKMTEIVNIEYLDTSEVDDMNRMFYNCYELTSLNLANFNTSLVTTMQSMFSSAKSLTALDLSSFNTQKVTDMYCMFNACQSLQSLNVSSFNTSAVTTMRSMFNNCSILTTLNLSNFDTTNVTTMERMFNVCYKLNSLNISSFNTSNVESMSGMFAGSELTTLDLSHFDTSKVTDMHKMFINCEELESLNISSFNTSKVTDMSAMFSNCTSLSSLNLSSFNTTNVTTMFGMFLKSSSLITLDLSNFDTTNVTDMFAMFSECASLTSVKLNKFNTINVKDMSYMFRNCSALEELNLSLFNTSNLNETYFAYDDLNTVYSDPDSLTKLTGTAMVNMFYGCSKLKNIVLGTKFYGLSGIGMFTGTTLLEKIISNKSVIESTDLLSYNINNGLGLANNAILYVRTQVAEALYEANSTYIDELDTDRIEPIMELIGESTVAVLQNSTYTDPGVTVAGWNKDNAINYTGLGYTLNSTSINTTTIGNKTVTYTLSHTDGNGTTTSMCSLTRTVKVVDEARLMAREDTTHMLGAYRDDNATTYNSDMVTKIIFTTEVPADYVDSWDVSETYGDKVIISYIVPSSKIGSVQCYDQYIVSPTEEVIVTTAKSLFYNYSHVTEIKNISCLNVNNVTDMSTMFFNCSSLTSLDLSKFNTANVSNMGNMFDDCTELSSLNISSFTTSNVTNMANMFADCSSLQSLDLSKFNTSNTTAMSLMFSKCTSLKTVNLNSFDTSKVTSMYQMFYGCTALEILDIRSFNTTSASTAFMLQNCSNLKILLLGENFIKFESSCFDGTTSLEKIISNRKATSSSEIINLLTSSKLGTANNAILYVPTADTEALYEANATYSGDLGADRIEPIMELVGDSTISVIKNATFTDPGVSVANWDKSSSTNYTSLGYTVTSNPASVSTAITGTQTITYTLKYTDSAGVETTLDSITRNVKVLEKAILMPREVINKDAPYILGAYRDDNETTYSGELITKVKFTTEIPEGYTDSWDVSLSGDKLIMSYLVPSEKKRRYSIL